MSIIKSIQIEVKDTCRGCPYSQYDPNYGMSYDSGYDCRGGKRIADDWQIRDWDNSIEAYEESLKTLFPLERPTNDPMIIPSWCPLPNKEA